MDDHELEERLARIVAEEDQAQAGVIALANRVGLYRKALILQGFTSDEAYALVFEFQLVLLGSSFGTEAEQP